MVYTVKYKSPGGLFWHSVKNVEGDTFYFTPNGTPMPVRVLLLADKSRIEIPMTWAIRFGRERFMDIKQTMSQQAGHDIPVKE